MGWKLINNKTGRAMEAGTPVITNKNRRATLVALKPPQPGEQPHQGLVTLQMSWSQYPHDYYPDIINAHYEQST